jgi:hypothetical protein
MRPGGAKVSNAARKTALDHQRSHGGQVHTEHFQLRRIEQLLPDRYDGHPHAAQLQQGGGSHGQRRAFDHAALPHEHPV